MYCNPNLFPPKQYTPPHTHTLPETPTRNLHKLSSGNVCLVLPACHRFYPSNPTHLLLLLLSLSTACVGVCLHIIMWGCACTSSPSPSCVIILHHHHASCSDIHSCIAFPAWMHNYTAALSPHLEDLSGFELVKLVLGFSMLGYKPSWSFLNAVAAALEVSEG